MNYTHLLNELNKASTFDLYRLSVAIDNELEKPQRILQVKQSLSIGMELSYFYYPENRLIKAKLLEMKQKKAVVFDYEKQTRYVVPYCTLNIGGANTDICEENKAENLTANMVKVGDWVGFNKDGESIVGVIKRINHKTVTLKTTIGQQWRVAYQCLYRVHEGETIIEETHLLR